MDCVSVSAVTCLTTFVSDEMISTAGVSVVESVKHSETVVNVCNTTRAVFDDGLEHEEMKCTLADRNSVWSHQKYTCNSKCVLD